MTLVFPADAVSQALTITVAATAAFPDDPKIFSGTVYEFGPDGTQFAQPVRLTIKYDPAVLPSGIRESELRLYEVAGGAWGQVTGSSANPPGDRVSGSITGFSIFGLLGVPVASVALTPSPATVTLGGTLRLSATPRDSDDNTLGSRPVSWSSSNSGITSVDATGLVTGVALGSAVITATSEGVSESAQIAVVRGTTTVAITSGPTNPRQGDVVTYTAETRDSEGMIVQDTTLTWSVSPASAGLFAPDGRFVGYSAGAASVVATASGFADSRQITISARGLSGTFSVEGRGPELTRFTSDLWVFGSFAYVGTWGCRNGVCGNRMFVWDISVPANPVLTDSVEVNATTVNDVKIRADGTIAVITHEGSSDGQNGITLLDLSDPAHPTVINRFTSGLAAGVHNAWIEGNHVYVVADGITAATGGLRVVDISDPANPTSVASFYGGSSFLHDVYVRDGLAFLSHWDAGLIIMDVGKGGAPAAPTNPIELSRIQTAGGQTHNAWYWPATGYVFAGEEDFGTPGVMHVVDASDLSNPREVATFQVPGDTPHNFWLDEARGILYMAWYSNGIRALDVSGELMGELDRQGREIASLVYDGAQTVTWAPQLHSGLIYVSDLSSGLWVLRPSF